jgi:hypothetical protein
MDSILALFGATEPGAAFCGAPMFFKTSFGIASVLALSVS